MITEGIQGTGWLGAIEEKLAKGGLLCKLWLSLSTSVISGLSPKTEAKPRSQSMTGYHMSKQDITGL